MTKAYEMGKTYRVFEENVVAHAEQHEVPALLVYLFFSDVFGREFTVEDANELGENGMIYSIEDYNVPVEWVEEV